MGKMENFYRSLGVPAAKNPASSEGRELDRKVRKIMDYLDRHGKGYFEKLSDINALLDRAASAAGLSMVDYVNTAVPYDRTVSLLLATSDPNILVHVSVYRMPSGRYELVAYPTRESLRRRGLQGKRRNPAGDLEDSLSNYVAYNVYWKLREELDQYPWERPIHRVPLAHGSSFAVKVSHYDPDVGMKLLMWTERPDDATGEGLRNSPLFVTDIWIDSSLVDVVSEALHYAMHNGTLEGFSHRSVSEQDAQKLPSREDYSDVPRSRAANPAIRLERNPEGEEEQEIDIVEGSAAEEEEPVEESYSAGVSEVSDFDDDYGDAEKVYETFHGRESEEEVVVEEAFAVRENLAALGVLEELTLTSPAKVKFKVAFEDDQPLLCSSTDSQQLYIIGGDQSIDDETLEEILDGDREAVQKDKVLLGVLSTLVYRTEKDFDNFETIDYEHELGEDGGFQPAVVYDRVNRQLELVGGSYKIKREGIVN